VDVETSGHVWLGLAGHHPLGVVILVPAVVERDDVHKEDVFKVGIQSVHAYFERGKHASVVSKQKHTCSVRHVLFIIVYGGARIIAILYIAYCNIAEIANGK